ncbi:MAG: helix-turn-helix transcriptional regulator [Kiritimatiellae bacterium]|nr:helix-turn-helix transcriptional regulator [Kiritimatiellia bacterium]
MGKRNMQSENNDKFNHSETVKKIRVHLGMTQAKVAQSLGISIRAIQSYEQGWRETPTHVMVQLLVLAAAYRSNAIERKPCWAIKGCPSSKLEKCPCYRTNGHFCWLVSGRKCAENRNCESNDLTACLNCPVVEQLLS